tara:strand:+ start:1275 stop:1478 length:204 start_codon:yes stop_codon:yes gene_type:complete
MTLSKPVEESLRASQEHLRDALAFAARSEKPFISKHIASFLADIDNLIDAQAMMENIRDQLTKRDEE